VTPDLKPHNEEEKKFYQWFRTQMNEHQVHIQRIENTVGSGIPDVNLCHKGNEAWVELKILTNGRTLLRGVQYAWGIKRSQAGGKVWVLCLDTRTEAIFMYRFPKVRVERYAKKYLAVTSTPQFLTYKKTKFNLLETLLFTV